MCGRVQEMSVLLLPFQEASSDARSHRSLQKSLSCLLPSPLCYVVNNPFVFQGACGERSLTDSSQGLCGCLQLVQAGQAVISAGSLLSVPRRAGPGGAGKWTGRRAASWMHIL